MPRRTKDPYAYLVNRRALLRRHADKGTLVEIKESLTFGRMKVATTGNPPRVFVASLGQLIDPQ
jgi:hypothetical protein